MESRESWERRWQLAKQRTDAKIIELHQISGNVQVRKIAIFFKKSTSFYGENSKIPDLDLRFWI